MVGGARYTEEYLLRLQVLVLVGREKFDYAANV